MPTHGAELSLQCLYPIDVGRLEIGLGASSGAALVWQEIPGWPNRKSVGFNAALLASLVWLFADPLVLSLEVQGGLEIHRHENAYKWSPVISTLLGGGFRF